MTEVTTETTATPKKKTTNGNGGSHLVRDVRELPTTSVVEAKRNYRKTFNDAEDLELAKSVKDHGVLQALLVRPKGSTFEVVFGNRRRRAAELAGLLTIPCEVRELGDLEALELRLVENVQRSDVHPLEEAEAFEELHEKHKKPIEEIAAMVGKSVGHIYQRIKLLALTKESREAFREGRFTPYHALLIARVPASLQAEAVKTIAPVREEWDDDTGKREKTATVLSARDAAAAIQRRFMLRLDQAPFDRKLPTLVAAAGACTVCPKRTGNQAELFADVKSPDLCTDSVCFEKKVGAHNKIALKAYAEKGAQIIDAKKVWPHDSDYVAHDATFIPLDETRWTGSKEETPRKVLGKLEASQIAVAIDPEGKLHELVRRKTFEDALPKRSGATGSATSKTEQARQKEARKRADVKRELTKRTLGAVAEAAEKRSTIDKAFWLFLARALEANAGQDTSLECAKRRGYMPTKKGDHYSMAHAATKKLKSELGSMTADELRGVVVELAASVGGWYGESVGPHLKTAAELYKVNLGKITTAIKAEKKAKKPAKKKAAKS